MSEKTEKNKNALKITHQSRSGAGMVYDLRADGNRLTVRVFPREAVGDSGEWRIEARTSDAPEAAVVSQWGATRIDALREVGRAWVATPPDQRLPSFDWEAVAQALLAVRAV